MNKIQKESITENAKLLAKRKKEYNPFDPRTQNSEYIFWARAYHAAVKYTPKQWARIVEIANR